MRTIHYILPTLILSISMLSVTTISANKYSMKQSSKGNQILLSSSLTHSKIQHSEKGEKEIKGTFDSESEKATATNRRILQLLPEDTKQHTKGLPSDKTRIAVKIKTEKNNNESVEKTGN